MNWPTHGEMFLHPSVRMAVPYSAVEELGTAGEI